MFLFSLLHGEDATAKASELGQFLLDLLQAFQSLTVSDLSFLLVATVIPVLVVQFFDLRNLAAEACDLFANNFDIIHAFKNSASAASIVFSNLGWNFNTGVKGSTSLPQLSAHPLGLFV